MKKKICIWGGGWSGLTAALEASESSDCEVHLYESSTNFGGKVSGTVSEKDKISTHAIRLISEYYPAFADVCSRIPTVDNKTLLDRWSPIYYFNFSSTSKNKVHKVHRKINKSFIGNIQLLRAALFTFRLRLKDIIKVAKAIKAFRILNEDEIKDLEEKRVSIKEYFEKYNLSDKAKDFLFTYLGITVAARADSMASMGMDLMSKMFIGTHRSNHLQENQYIQFRSWVIDGPLGDRLIPPFIAELQKRNVHLHTNSRLSGFKKTQGDKTIAKLNEHIEVEADAHILALNNKVIENLGFGRTHQPLNNEWSIGVIFPITSIPKSLEKISKKSVTAVMDSEWAIVFVIWCKESDGGLWSNDITFPKEYNYFLEVVASRLDKKGTTDKTFFECNPQDALNEILTQIGIHKNEIPDIISNAKFCDNLEYVNESTEDKFSLYGPKNKEDYRWRLYAPIYTASPETPPLDQTTKCKHIYLCGEAVKTEYSYIKTPTLELTSETAKAVVQNIFDEFSIPQKVNQEYPSRFAKRQSN
ncbi:hypothetical protein GCM10022393_10250 [Aquimarina addita]|uniref:Amine oxidase domain-containing protein n=1 Tax=Aquimarina addita TaxID=870485 RepID=A0ABP7XCX9_9FLAO